MTDICLISVTKAHLNKPLYPCKTQTVALTITNLSLRALQKLTVCEPCINIGFSYAENSAVIFIKGKMHPLKTHITNDKITFEKIYIPPKEKILVFYRMHEN